MRSLYAAGTPELWLLAHPDLRDTVRVKAVYQWMSRLLEIIDTTTPRHHDNALSATFAP